MTLHLLWEEYRAAHEDGYGYSQFCEIYRRWARKLRPSMRQQHRAGEKTFIDFSGKRPHLVDRRTGEEIPVELFVAVLGASGYTYAEATRTQKLDEWVGAHTRMVEYFGGSTELWVPDQLKSAVTRSVPLRARPQPHLPGAGRALLRGRDPGPPRQAQGQGQGGVDGARGPALDPGPAAQPDVLRAGRAERGDLGAAGAAQLAADAEARGEPTTSSGNGWTVRLFQPLPTTPLRAGPVDELPGQHRLPRRGGPPPLLRPLPARPREGRDALHRLDRRGLLQGPACGFARPALRPWARDPGRAHAQLPPGARRVDSLAADPLGARRRARPRDAWWPGS